eukprot:CAMPEP_0119561588 /NCGR_PEP_ID=MMETSP1352-20130426/18043_1 /TAXON_ID=265584 /ORGANISM="Stauroneis constricta, Strain CCMP1120" /LENGTH=213 /DNA_ID=CAMNT_0007609821 /DNA_START=126 /DNA_END=767 /DNA_ORIENTATION=-
MSSNIAAAAATPQAAATATKSTPTTETSKSSSNNTTVEDAVTRLKELGINLLAIDFDQTIVSVHTYGRWKDTVPALIPHIRTELKQLILLSVQNDIQIAIVTFSPQIRIVRGILEAIFADDNPEFAQTIPIRGGDRSWEYKGNGSLNGKQPHIASAVEELEHRDRSIEITRSTTVLIDDDDKNIVVALNEGTRAVWLNPKKPHRLFKDIKRLV